MLPVYAGELDRALSKGKPVLLYMYTDECGGCAKFSPVYEQLAKDRTDFTYLKINASTWYGYNLMRQFRVSYVPFVAMFKPNSKDGAQISNGCLYNMACMNKVLTDFKK